MGHSDETMFPAAPDNLNQPSNWLVAVIDDPRKAEEAERALIKAGFAQDDVLLLHGQEALQRLRDRDERRGPLGWVMKAIADVVTDAGTFEDKYAAEANAGHAIINLQVSDQDQIERAREIIVAHGGHYIKHFGDWAITDLS